MIGSEWSKIGPMKEPRCRCQGVEVFNDNIYVMGGVGDKGVFKDTVEWFNACKNQWEVIGK